MRPGLFWIWGLAALVSAGAAPRELVIEVDAGPRERKDTPVCFTLPEGLRDAGPFVLRSPDGDETAPLVSPGPDGGGPEIAWIVRGRLRAGARRRYRLTAGATGIRTGDLSFGRPTPALPLRLDGRTILAYHTEAAEPPPGIDPLYRRSGFIHPLATRSGLVLTDAFPPDHPHQHGLFFAWVNTTFEGRRVDFWNQAGRTGRVLAVGEPATFAGSGTAEFLARLRHDDLTAPGGPVPVLDERWRVRVYNLPDGVVIDFESTQRCAGVRPLTVNKYHYGGLGLRGSRRWFDPGVRGDEPPDPARSGRSDFLTSEGRRRANGNHTRPRWADLSGEVAGRVGGVAILGHPSNFRFPQPVRIHPNKPYFCFAPVVLGPFEIAPGRPYVSRYRIHVHDGPPEPAVIERLWADYAEPPTAAAVPGG